MCDLCRWPAGRIPGGPDNDSEVGTFIFYLENVIPVLKEHHFVSLDVVVILFPGLWFPLTWTVAAATWPPSPTLGLPPPACLPDSGTPWSEGHPSPNERKAERSHPTPLCSVACLCWDLTKTWPCGGHALTSPPPDFCLCLGCLACLCL